jgi:putative hemolysin
MEDEPKIEKIDEKTYDCEGITPIDKVNELLHTNLASKRYDTVGGWLLEHLGRLPKQGESIIAEGLEITAKKLSGARIEQVRIAKK